MRGFTGASRMVQTASLRRRSIHSRSSSNGDPRAISTFLLIHGAWHGGGCWKVAEHCPSRVRLLVYVAAYMPRDGCSVADQPREDVDSLIDKYIEVGSIASSPGLLRTGRVRPSVSSGRAFSMSGFASSQFTDIAPVLLPVGAARVPRNSAKPAFRRTNLDLPPGARRVQLGGLLVAAAISSGSPKAGRGGTRVAAAGLSEES